MSPFCRRLQAGGAPVAAPAGIAALRPFPGLPGPLAGVSLSQSRLYVNVIYDDGIEGGCGAGRCTRAARAPGRAAKIG